MSKFPSYLKQNLKEEYLWNHRRNLMIVEGFVNLMTNEGMLVLIGFKNVVNGV